MKKSSDPRLSDFAERITALTDPFGSIAKASKALNIPANTLSRLRRGENEPTPGVLLDLVEGLRVSMDYLLGLSDEPTALAPKIGRPLADPVAFERIPRLDVRAAAGAGSINHMFAVDGELAFPHWMLQKLAPPGAKLSFLRAKGDSMEPTIVDGALLLVAETNGDFRLPDRPPKPKHGSGAQDIYVFLQGDDLRVKRLRKAKHGAIFVMSDNQDYEPELLLKVDLKRLKICGRVVWWDNRL
ncbi:S24 family peptidase [Methylosinus sp. KRF6]|uniref:XRE family transcriptional regulator n=1 Tax=Methylosinus sp. KRF6 TaxID=2846853 RepID=UPI001C0CC6D3|nr:S24 family peptidase [Methylosinus sp. KRF6]MBU3890090.1 helix-turn-helix domain-containing protein [Methylosinus sp. KRF6]